MNTQQTHRDIASRLLVAHSLPTGLPWSMEDERSWVVQERLLWMQMENAERDVEQTWLQELWGHKGKERTLPVNPTWGPWTTNLPATVSIPDKAFGPGYRPFAKGHHVLCEERPDKAETLRWLWGMGFQPVDVTSQGVIRLLVPVSRIIQEADRLFSVLHQAHLTCTVDAAYNPATGIATLNVIGV